MLLGHLIVGLLYPRRSQITFGCPMQTGLPDQDFDGYSGIDFESWTPVWDDLTCPCDFYGCESLSQSSVQRSVFSGALPGSASRLQISNSNPFAFVSFLHCPSDYSACTLSTVRYKNLSIELVRQRHPQWPMDRASCLQSSMSTMARSCSSVVCSAHPYRSSRSPRHRRGAAARHRC